MTINWKKILWWSFIAGIGFTFGAAVVRLIYMILVWGLAIDQILPWVGSLFGGRA